MRKKHTSLVRVLLVAAIVCSLVVITVAPAGAQSAVLNPAAGPVGSSVTVTATGFAPGSPAENL